ncbi:MAG: hypothetical protein U0003_05515 [Vampirovibrionales bacterium]
MMLFFTRLLSLARAGQSVPEFALVAALIAIAVASSLGGVKNAIDHQAVVAAQSISADGLVETSAGECRTSGNGGGNGGMGTGSSQKSCGH